MIRTQGYSSGFFEGRFLRVNCTSGLQFSAWRQPSTLLGGGLLVGSSKLLGGGPWLVL